VPLRRSEVAVACVVEDTASSGPEKSVPCSLSSCSRNEVVMMLSNCLDSEGVRGTLGCVRSLRLAATEAAGRRRRWGVGLSMAMGGCGSGSGSSDGGMDGG